MVGGSRGPGRITTKREISYKDSVSGRATYRVTESGFEKPSGAGTTQVLDGPGYSMIHRSLVVVITVKLCSEGHRRSRRRKGGGASD